MESPLVPCVLPLYLLRRRGRACGHVLLPGGGALALVRLLRAQGLDELVVVGGRQPRPREVVEDELAVELRQVRPAELFEDLGVGVRVQVSELKYLVL